VPIHDLNRAIEAIVQSAESQSRLIEDLLDLSRLTSGKFSLVPSTVVVDSVARAAVDVVRPSALAKGIKLELDAPEDLGSAVLDAARLKQILWNLLSNATKFTPERGNINLRMRKVDGFLEVKVTDTGMGIAPEFMPHVFERFRQADMGETRLHSGLGIGLALTRHLVELQGGTIEAHSKGLGRGAMFRVRLPWIDPSGEGDTVTRNPASTPSLEGMTILLAEDDHNTREAMQWTLVNAGARVVAVASGPEALAALDHVDPVSWAAAPFDAIVCDLGLPGMSGYELLDRVKQRFRARGERLPPACAVSAHAREVDRSRAIEAGFDLYLTKPVMPERLVEAVQDLRDVATTSSSTEL
jgi:CheY-like chemotaxis protein